MFGQLLGHVVDAELVQAVVVGIHPRDQGKDLLFLHDVENFLIIQKLAYACANLFVVGGHIEVENVGPRGLTAGDIVNDLR